MRKLKEPVSIEFQRLHDSRSAIFVQERVIDKIITEEREDGHGNKFTVCPNDIALFIEQSKLLKFDRSVQQGVLQDFARMAAPLSESLRGQSDTDIIQSVKSRYIQSTTDVHNYSRALSDAIRSEFESVKARVDERRHKLKEKDDQKPSE